jgi:hypothetical protein
MGTVHAGTPEDPIRIATDYGPARLYFDPEAWRAGWVLLYRTADGRDGTRPLEEKAAERAPAR